MSCDIAAAAFLFLASAGPAPASPHGAPSLSSVAKEPLFVDIINRAGRLKAQTDAYGKAITGPSAVTLPGFEAFQAEVGRLSALDMQGHLTLAGRGTDGDLKCILKGISQDLPLKLKDLQAAASGPAQSTALRDLSYLLNDNVEVITAPPAPPA